MTQGSIILVNSYTKGQADHRRSVVQKLAVIIHEWATIWPKVLTRTRTIITLLRIRWALRMIRTCTMHAVRHMVELGPQPQALISFRRTTRWSFRMEQEVELETRICILRLNSRATKPNSILFPAFLALEPPTSAKKTTNSAKGQVIANNHIITYTTSSIKCHSSLCLRMSH